MKPEVLAAKEAIVEDIKNKFGDAGSVVVVEYRGLNVADITQLRRALRAEQAAMEVFKNSMVQRAVDALGLAELDETLKGPNAFVFGPDEVTAARILADFARTHKALVIKNGVVNNEYVTSETIGQLASLPNKDGMIAKFASALNAPVVKFAMTIKALAEKMEGGSDENSEAAPAEAAA